MSRELKNSAQVSLGVTLGAIRLLRWRPKWKKRAHPALFVGSVAWAAVQRFFVNQKIDGAPLWAELPYEGSDLVDQTT